MTGLTQLDDVVYVSSQRSSAILRFSVVTWQRLTDVVINGLDAASDIAACEGSSQLYVSDKDCIWRVSADGSDKRLWLPKSPDNTFKPCKLSVTATRLLVTAYGNHLIQFDVRGQELRRVQLPELPDVMKHSEYYRNAVESPTGTFITSRHHTQLNQFQVIEVNTGGEVLRQFSGSHLTSLHNKCPCVAVDSHGYVLVPDVLNNRILLLDARLSLRRIIIEAYDSKKNSGQEIHHLNFPPDMLCYREPSGQLVVGADMEIKVFDVLRR